jgi:glyceraldehyde 3-phosphate dehydrogenase
MKIPCALNGFGRIGKTLLRTIASSAEARALLDIRVINVGNAAPEEIAYSCRYDTIMGRYPGAVSYQNGVLTLDDLQIEIIAELNPEKLPWGRYGIQWVVDASGAYTQRNRAMYHIKAGARKVLITAPAEGEDCAIVAGVNDALYNPQHHAIVSLGSCTTNALMPILSVLEKSFGITEAIATTVHAYTPSQSLHDGIGHGGDPRRMRAAAANIVPASTGAATMIAKIMPELAGKVVGRAVRVPVNDVSLIEVIAVLKKPQHLGEIHDALTDYAARNPSIMEISDLPLVSSDFKGTSASVVIDTTLSDTVANLCHVAGWYDNEWGYSCRVRDFLCAHGARR